jgi:UPF0755 protein
MKKILFVAILLILAVGSWVGVVYYQKLFAPVTTSSMSFYVYTGSTYEDVKQQLAHKGLINDEKLFDLVAEKMNFSSNIYPGHYVLDSALNQIEVMRILRSGSQTPVKVVINNVNFKKDLAKKVANQLEIDENHFYRYMASNDSLKKWNMNTHNVLTYFIPNTYEMYWNTSVDKFIDRMQKEHKAFWNMDRLSKAAAWNLSPAQVYVLASIVEKEYKHADERSRIAGVYLNRLRINMILQADPTVKYAIGDLSIKRVLKIHTEYDSPYNTYKYKGLPPGPICMPETSTIDAVLNAEKHDYLYFCARADMSGYHTFSKNYNDHINAAKKYHAALNKLKVF